MSQDTCYQELGSTKGCCQRVCQCKGRPTGTSKQKETRILRPLLVDQIKVVHLLFLVVLLPAEAQDAKLFLLLLRLRHAVL
ncbi:hypothetical protein ACP4OV_017771 [Aristida adscensionis]